MIYNLVEADEILARLDNDFNVTSGDYVGRVPQWIYQCLSDLNIRTSLIPKAYVANVENYLTTLPNDIKYLTCIEYNNYRLERKSSSSPKFQTINSPGFATIRTNIGLTITGNLTNVTLDNTLDDIVVDVTSIRVRDASSVIELPMTDEYYYMHSNGNIETSFESGIIIIHYYAMATSYNETLNSQCPLIPDNEAVKDAIAWYIFQSLLQRGYKHPVFTLGNPNGKLDPFERYRKARLNAKNKSNHDDPDAAKIIDGMWNSALYNVITD